MENKSKGLEELKLIEKGIEWNKLDTVSYRIFKAKFITIEKELKALEIIKKRFINLDFELESNEINGTKLYFITIGINKFPILLNEYELLREELKNE